MQMQVTTDEDMHIIISNFEILILILSFLFFTSSKTSILPSKVQKESKRSERICYMRRISVIAAASISLIASTTLKMTSSRGAFILFEGKHDCRDNDLYNWICLYC
jgi:hypothetical protein